MKTKKFQKAIIIFVALTLIGLIINFGIRTHKYDLTTDEAGSIAIIGGADGPTSIFITGTPSIGPVFLIFVISLGLVLYVVYKKKTYKQ